MYDRVWNTAKELTNHVCLVVLRDRVKGFLNDVAAKWIHAQRDDIAMNSVSNGDNLVRRAMLEASLNKEVAKTIDHERVCLIDDGLHNLELLFSRADLELLLEEDGSLLIVVAHNLVDDVFPVTRDRLVKESTIIHWLQ